jgi:agmatine deiminase
MSAPLMPAKTPCELGYRMPAEWERHEATWLAWPHNPDDWPGKFQAIPWLYAEIVRLLAAHEFVHILVEDVKSEHPGARRSESRPGELSLVAYESQLDS